MSDMSCKQASGPSHRRVKMRSWQHYAAPASMRGPHHQDRVRILQAAVMNPACTHLHNDLLPAQMAAVALGVVGAGAAVVAGVRPSGMAALCLCAWGLAEAGAALWERLRQEAAPGAALWGMPWLPIIWVCINWPDLA